MAMDLDFNAMLQEEADKLRAKDQVQQVATYLLNGVETPQPTAESGYAIPEFPADTAPAAQETQARTVQYTDPLIGAAPTDGVSRSQNNLYQRDPSGQVLVTPISSLPKAAPSETTPELSPAQLHEHVLQGIRQIDQTDADPVQRMQLLTELKTTATTYKLQEAERVGLAIEERLGVPRLEEALALSQEKDRTNPNQLLRGMDSQLTQQIQKQLATVKQQALQETQTQLAKNVIFPAIDNQLEMAAAIFNRRDAANQRVEASQEQKTFTKELEDQRLLEATSPEMIRRMGLIDPSFVGQSPAMTARYINRGVTDTNIKEALVAPDEALVGLAIAGQNKAAERILIDREATKTGQDVDTVARQLTGLKARMLNDAELRKNLAILYPQPKDREASLAVLTRARLGGTKADQQAALELKYEIATRVQQRVAEQRFLGQPVTWDIQDPEFVAAVDRVKKANGTAPIAAIEVFDAYVGDRKGPERAIRQQQFFGLMEQAAAPLKQSLIAPVNTEFMRQQLISDMNKKMMDTYFGESVIPGLRYMNQQTGDAIRTIEAPFRSFFGGFDNGE